MALAAPLQDSPSEPGDSSATNQVQDAYSTDLNDLNTIIKRAKKDTNIIVFAFRVSNHKVDNDLAARNEEAVKIPIRWFSTFNKAEKSIDGSGNECADLLSPYADEIEAADPVAVLGD
jgi:hypothetical protein